MQKKYIEELVENIKKGITQQIKKKKYSNALGLISMGAEILYKTNIYYKDKQLEHYIFTIAKEISLQNDINPLDRDDDVILFWDGFGIENRGLVQIYIKALKRVKKIIYVTYKDREKSIPIIKNLLRDGTGELFFVDRDRYNYIKTIEHLIRIVNKTKVKHFIFYSTPDDVVATTVMYRYAEILNRVQINLTDHAFWLGTGCIDKCIEFREYGARISLQYRGIKPDKIIRIPFYPVINEVPFEGYPYRIKKSQIIVFSGGALYKTFGEGNKYYKIVKKILRTYKNVVFWYAGYGDDAELKKLIREFPDRVWYTKERHDLYEVMKRCRFYLNTYPVVGGLMFQYAAVSGKVPVTLLHSEDSEGLLLDQNNLNVGFINENEMFEEIDHLITDETYYKHRTREMLNAVIPQEQFDKEVEKIFNGEDSCFPINYTIIDTSNFRKLYIDSLTEEDVDLITTRKNVVFLGWRYYPKNALNGCRKRLKLLLRRR